MTITTIARDFRAELDAAAAAGDWAAHETIWDERRFAEVARDEAQLIQHPAPTHDQVVVYLQDYYAKNYTTKGVFVGLTHPSAEDDVAAVDVNVYVYFTDNTDEVHNWTVWIEDVGNGPFVYGEW